MTAEPDLLPCPWCGEKLKQAVVLEGSTFRWRRVAGCCADGPEVRHDTMADDQAAAEVESTAAAIAAWNTRACVTHATAAKDAEVEALRAERDLFRDETIELVRQNGEWQARAERLAEALRWYAEQAAGCRKLGRDGDAARAALDADGGGCARAALEQEAGRG